MKTEAVLFDLDGTLADTAPDLGAALNRLLRRHGLPEKDLRTVAPAAGSGAPGLLAFGAGMTADHPDFEAWRQEYLQEYEAGLCVDTVLFDGIAEVLHHIRDKGLKWGIITNKAARFTDKLVPQLPFDPLPEVVVSGDTAAQPKPSAEPMLYACDILRVSPENCVYIGDALRDVQAGKNAGMRTIAAAWGYIENGDSAEVWGADAVALRPADLSELIS